MSWNMKPVCCACCGDLHNPCGDFKGSGHKLRLGAHRLPQEYDPWCAIKEAVKSKVLALLIIDRFYHRKFTPNNFFFRKLLFRLHNHCKNISWFSWTYYDFLVLWLACVRPKTNTTPFEVTRQVKPMSKHSRRHRCCSTRVVYICCGDVESNS